jgi:glycosyltransferase involved in cell wall biosynthesis
MQKRRIAVIVRSAQKGGVESHVYDLLKKSLSLGYDPVLISLSNAPADGKFLNLGIEVVLLSDNYAGSFRSFMNIFALRRLLRSMRPALIHCHSTRPIIIGSLAARLAGIRNIILTVHNSYKLMAIDNACLINTSLLTASKLMHYAGFCLSRCIITVSKMMSQEIENDFKRFPLFRRVVAPKMKIIHNGIDTARFNNKTRYIPTSVHDVATGLKVIGTIGRLDPMKGINVLLRSAKKLSDKGLSFRLLIAGDGRSKEDLWKLIGALGLHNRVQLLGHYDEPKTVYDLMDIFVLPSFSEGFALVIPEAMACGLPVVSTPVGCAPEIIRNNINGIIIPPNDSDALAGALEYLIVNDAARLRMGEEGAKTISGRFTAMEMMDKTFAVYEKALAAR